MISYISNSLQAAVNFIWNCQLRTKVNIHVKKTLVEKLYQTTSFYRVYEVHVCAATIERSSEV